MALTKKGDLLEEAFGLETRNFMAKVDKNLKDTAKKSMRRDGTTDDWNVFLNKFTSKQAGYANEYASFSNYSVNEILKADGQKTAYVDTKDYSMDRQQAKIDASIRGVYNLQNKWRSSGLELLDDTTYNGIVNNMVNGALKNVLSTGRQVQQDSAKKTKTSRYFRKSVGLKTCNFCLMLISRGPAYLSRESASFSTHPKCDCVAVPAGENWTMSKQDYDRVNEWYKKWYPDGSGIYLGGGRTKQWTQHDNVINARLETDKLFFDEMSKLGYVEEYKAKIKVGQTASETQVRVRLNQKYYRDFQNGNLGVQRTIDDFRPDENKPNGIGDFTNIDQAFQQLIRGYNE